MPKRMLIDASHPEETRVVVLDGNKVEEFDFEAASRRPLKGNIYLAKVTRVEPSLQAAFVEYGGNRQGFLAFSEIHPDYYQIPVADRQALLAAQTQRMMAEDDFDAIDMKPVASQQPVLEGGEDQPQVSADEEAAFEDSDGETASEAESAVGGPADHEGPAAETIDAGARSETDSDDAVISEDATGSGEGDDTAFAREGVTPPESSEDWTRPAAESQTEAAPVVQAEATGAPQPHQRREKRQNWPRPPRRRQYKIQEVIKRRQILLVQVVKEERGTKGASLTTFLSLAGRYCVLMPNTPRGGGISRKITNATDRKRLKSAAQSLELPEGMGLIIRTAGANRTKLEIKRDYEYLLRLWDTVRELTLKSNAPALVYEEGSLIKRAIRDLYNKDISEVQVDGEAGYRDAKDFMRMIMPSHAKNVKPYKETLPLFQRFQVESQLDAMFSPTVTLKSGGYVVINQTEALVAIDVNSGKATREHSIEETAHKTNLEAADEIARQLRLRDLAGLIVIDFIDMEDGKNDRNVEKRLHNAVKGDRARIQIGKISQFGLLEMSRQRLRAGVIAGSTVTCPHCAGLGIIRSTESAALRLLRALDEEGQRSPGANVSVKAPEDVSIYTLNHKRQEIARIEADYDLQVTFEPQTGMMGGSFELERTGLRVPNVRPKAVSVEAGFPSHEPELVQDAAEPAEPDEEVVVEQQAEDAAPREHDRNRGDRPQHQQGDVGGEGGGRKRRRRRRGGRGRNGGQPSQQESHQGGGEHRHGQPQHPNRPPLQHAEAAINVETGSENDTEFDAMPEIAGEATQIPASGQQPPMDGDRKRRRRRRGRRGRRREGEQGMTHPMGASENHGQQTSETSSVETERSFPAVRHEDSFVTEAVAPNAPSSPQWSLTEPVRDEPEPVAATSEPAAAASPPPERKQQPEAEPPKEPRKGWWQRRLGL
jgi:ribonuclease E